VKALSVKQPWANMIAMGKKTIETRTWQTSYRGPLLICSSKVPLIEPAGKALCIVELYAIAPMLPEHEKAACCEIYDGAYSWFLQGLLLLPEPFEVRGMPGLFEVELPQCGMCGDLIPKGAYVCDKCQNEEIMRQEMERRGPPQKGDDDWEAGCDWS